MIKDTCRKKMLEKLTKEKDFEAWAVEKGRKLKTNACEKNKVKTGYF